MLCMLAATIFSASTHTPQSAVDAAVAIMAAVDKLIAPVEPVVPATALADLRSL
jgi:hypothetical protein